MIIVPKRESINELLLYHKTLSFRNLLNPQSKYSVLRREWVSFFPDAFTIEFGLTLDVPQTERHIRLAQGDGPKVSLEFKV